MSTKRTLTCCVCGGPAGRFEQHWNRDTGYGICARCVADEAGKSSAEELLSRYGTPGVNYEQPLVRHYGLDYAVVAAFPRSEAGTNAANSFMERNPETGLLCITDRAYLVRMDDNGAQPSKAG